MPQAPDTKTLGKPFIELQSVDSTNNYARERIKEVELTGRQLTELDGTTFFSHEQRAGKGQRGRSWSSQAKANITMSLVLVPASLEPTQQFQLSALIAVSLCEFFTKYAGENTRIKWPNDLYWQDRKAGGILIESGIASPSQNEKNARWNWAIVGIGLNINQTIFPPDLPNPVSLKQITGKEYDRIEMARECLALINDYYQLFSRKGFFPILEAYNENLYKRNEKVRLRKDNRIFEALIKGVSSRGLLCVEHAIQEEYNFGEIEWVIP